MTVTSGFEDDERPRLAKLYWAAFGDKLGRVMGPTPRALAYIEDVADPTHVLCARDGTGLLVGVVGFKTYDGAFVGGTWRDLTRHYGQLGAIWRAGLLALLDRDVDNRRFLIDGICVHETARGRGVGTALIAAICDEARTRGYAEIRLDVIDTNPRAQALYERLGFVAQGRQKMGPLGYIFGFAASTTMIRRL